MKNVFARLMIFMVVVPFQASAAFVQCLGVDSAGEFNIRESVDLTKDLQREVGDRTLPEIKFQVSFSSALKAVDSAIRDEQLGIKALSTEWINQTAKGAHSAVRLTTPKGDYILSCSVVGIE